MKHTTGTMVQARQMVDSGWSAYKVAQILGVSRTTVRKWTDPQYAEHRRSREADNTYKRRHKSGAHFGRQHFRPETRARRMAELSEAGLKLKDVAKVMRLDFGVDLSPEQVAYSLKHDAVPRPLRGKAAV